MAGKLELLGVMRHGDYEYQNGVGVLTENGRKQTIVVASFINEFMERWYGPNYLQAGLSIVISSIATRARETAEILSGQLGLYHHVDRSLGDEEGKDFAGYYIKRQLGSILGAYRDIFLVTHEHQTGYLPGALHPKVRGERGYLMYSCANIYDEKGNQWAFRHYRPGVFPPLGIEYETNHPELLID